MTSKLPRLGKYQLLERLHAGSIAEVFLAKAGGVEGFERIVALKKILPLMAEDEEFHHLFLDEARISVQLSHANIVHTLEFGKEDDSFFIVMEYVAGKDLRALLDLFRRTGTPAPIPLAAHVLTKVCEGLDYAHRKKDPRNQDLNIVHRAVAPQNVLVSYDGEVKLIDFGMAKAANRLQKTQAGVLRGQTGYMSPEQVRGEPLDRRTDIFAAGVVLYELLTGTKLFQGDSDFSTMELVANANVPQPTGLNPNIPDELEAVMLKALARDPNDRYQYASELQEALARFQLAGDTLYSSSQLSAFLKTSFDADLKREAERMERFASVSASTPGSGPKRRPTREGKAVTISAPLSALADATNPKARPDLPFDVPEEEARVDRTVIVSLDGASAGGDGLSGSTQIAHVIPEAPPPLAAPAKARTATNLKAIPKLTQAPATRPKTSGPGASDATILAAEAMAEVTSPGRRPTGPKPTPSRELPRAELPRPELTQSRRLSPEDLLDEDPLEVTNPVLQFPGAAAGSNTGSNAPPPRASASFRPPVLSEDVPARTDPGTSRPSARASSAAASNRKLLIGAAVGLVAVLAIVLALVLGRDAGGSGIVVRVTPSDSAKVTVNGRLISPNRVTHFPPGDYELVATAPGYQRHAQKITIFKDDTEAVFDISLEREDAADSNHGSAATDSASRTFSATFRTSEPGVEVLVDGQSIGSTPNARIADLQVGTKHHYVARKTGFETAEGDVTSSSASEVQVEFEMKPEAEVAQAESKPEPKNDPPSHKTVSTSTRAHGEKRGSAKGGGRLVCTSNPTGAAVIIDGHAVNRRTPITADRPLDLAPGKHRVLFQIAGLESELIMVDIREGQTVELKNVKVEKENSLF